jgi:hypothetical protein
LFYIGHLAHIRQTEISPDRIPQRQSRDSGKKNTDTFHLILLFRVAWGGTLELQPGLKNK